MHVSFKIHYRNNLIDRKDSYLISCPPSWDDRNYRYSHQLYPSEQWRLVNDSDCQVCKKNENYKHFYFNCKYMYYKTYWQEVKKLTTNLYIGDHVFYLETVVFGYKIYDQAYFVLNLLITLIFFYMYKAYYISNQKQKKVDIFKFFKDEVNNVFDTNIFRQVKTGNLISKAHVYLNS
jgi:hypothetical protein